MVKVTANDTQPETIRLDKSDWIKLGGGGLACLASIAAASWQIAGSIREASVAYEARMTKAETRLDGHDRDLGTLDRRVGGVEGQLRGRTP